MELKGNIQNQKSLLLTYLLWFFLGYLGIHRIYCNRAGSGVVMLLLFLIGTFLAFIGIGFLFLIPLGIWWLLDALLILTWFK